MLWIYFSCVQCNYKWITKIHRTLYRVSGGRIGAKMGALPIVLMHTIGRKSGQVRSVPLACYTFHPDGLLIHASNNGSDKPPIWWLNLQHTPKIDVQFGREKRQVHAEEVGDDVYEDIWQQMTERNKYIHAYRSQTSRKIPIILLKTIEPNATENSSSR